ncbi:Calcineurin-like phosphoesterase [Tenacibaculum sp. MAR_2009_124]|uniref:metallophosphoesterase family protein n=1 Tax=Tenacibaculum sp. MAR_2009_124 TaxID=1250059 RepID=UPI000898B52A|nr:metallophosphoesterase [Tenacibaculum sp. MAR_2009_124]SEB51255.1 Calcineurin-like phosphoesterase [Tenacibaculum sp. MAR_2009_124]
MKKLIMLVAICVVCMYSCQNKQKKTSTSTSLKTTSKDSVSFSFVFLGCNRVDRHQQGDSTATNASTANLSAMKRIWTEISDLETKPDLFFFLGDMVLAESNTTNLENQLVAWKKLYCNVDFSPISLSKIEMVAVPGNHEMLYWHDYNVPHHDEWPLKGATEIWMNEMEEFMPEDRDVVKGRDSINNQMTFSFVRKNIGFILMNTDTYNEPTKENPYGLEGQIPTQWIINKVKEYKKKPSIDHVFVLGHKPYYVSGKPKTGHKGLPEGPVLWPKLEENKVVAMLSAHLHDYQRMQPGNKGTYQIIAGNAGSPGEAKFFGYSKIDILGNGEVRLTSMGYNIGDPYYAPVPENPSTLRDSTILTWEANKNPYQNQKD